MLKNSILILVILGASVSSEPIRRSIIMPNDVITSVLSDYVHRLELSVAPETMKSMKNFINNAIGLKLSGLEIAVNIAHWVTANFISIAIGSILAFGVCKITGKCSLSYDKTFSKLYSFLTPDQLESAQRVLISAMNRFEQDDTENDEEENVGED